MRICVIWAFLAILQTVSGRRSPYIHEEHCYVTEHNKCLLNEFSVPTRVFLGGETRCADGSPYSIHISPGYDGYEDHVASILQEGGACIDEETCAEGINDFINQVQKNPLYRRNIQKIKFNGILDQFNVLNPIHKYTIILVLYCTGDIHLGNIARRFGKGFVFHNGAINVDAYKKLLFESYPNPRHKIFIGSSAGSLAVPIIADGIINHYKNELKSTARFSVLGDSFLGVFPPEKIGSITDWWAICDVDYGWSDEFVEACRKGTLDFHSLTADIIRRHPDVRFGYVQPAQDYIQKKFFCLARHGLKALATPPCISESNFIEETKSIIRQYSEAGQAYAYVLPESRHIYLPKKHLYTASISRRGDVDSLITWVTKFFSEDESIQSFFNFGDADGRKNKLVVFAKSRWSNFRTSMAQRRRSIEA